MIVSDISRMSPIKNTGETVRESLRAGQSRPGKARYRRKNGKRPVLVTPGSSRGHIPKPERRMLRSGSAQRSGDCLLLLLPVFLHRGAIPFRRHAQPFAGGISGRRLRARIIFQRPFRTAVRIPHCHSFRRDADDCGVHGLQPNGIAVADRCTGSGGVHRHVFDLAGDGSAGERRRTARPATGIGWVLQCRLGRRGGVRLFYRRRAATKVGLEDHVLRAVERAGPGTSPGHLAAEKNTRATRRVRVPCPPAAASDERKLPLANRAGDFSEAGVGGQSDGLFGDQHHHLQCAHARAAVEFFADARRIRLLDLAVHAGGSVRRTLVMARMALPISFSGSGLRRVDGFIRGYAVGAFPLGAGVVPGTFRPGAGTDLLFLAVLFHGCWRYQRGTRRHSRGCDWRRQLHRAGSGGGDLAFFPGASWQRGVGRLPAAGAGLDRLILAALPGAKNARLIYATDRRLTSHADVPANPVSIRTMVDGSGTAVGVKGLLAIPAWPCSPISLTAAYATDSPVGSPSCVPVVICENEDVLSKVKVSNPPGARAGPEMFLNWIESPSAVPVQPVGPAMSDGEDGRLKLPMVQPYQRALMGSEPVLSKTKEYSNSLPACPVSVIVAAAERVPWARLDSTKPNTHIAPKAKTARRARGDLRIPAEIMLKCFIFIYNPEFQFCYYTCQKQAFPTVRCRTGENVPSRPMFSTNAVFNLKHLPSRVRIPEPCRSYGEATTR